MIFLMRGCLMHLQSILLPSGGYGHTNKEVMATVGKENGWEPLASYTEGSLFQKPSDPALRERMIKEWELIKSGF